jgi:Cu(I)/Ag(I) efflux system membrane fusion protein
MKPVARISVTLAVILAAGVAGYWLGQNAPDILDHLAPEASHEMEGSSFPAPARPPTSSVIYYRDPDGKPFYSAQPKLATNGRPYVPVYSDQDVTFDNEPTDAASPGMSTAKRILYYRHPMGLPDISPVPRKDNMGMDYLPVYEDGMPDDNGTVTISPERIQRSGVRTETVERRIISRPLLAPAVVRVDESRVKVVALRGEGFIEELFVNRTGEPIKAGQPLFRVYMPQLQQAQVDLLLAIDEPGRAAAAQQRLIQGASQKLRNLGVPESFIKSVIEARANIRTIDWPSPITGIVLEKRIVEGQRAMPGDELYRVADLSSVWVIAEVPEYDLAGVRVGDPVSVTFRAYPGETRSGKVAFIYPDLNPETRTARIRIELPNPDSRLRVDMYAEVDVRSAANGTRVVAVPDSALIESGKRQIVLISRGAGRFEPRAVTVGRRGEGYVEITAGVKEGEEVVTAATFLIDAESNLKAALRSFVAPEAKP